MSEVEPEGALERLLEEQQSYYRAGAPEYLATPLEPLSPDTADELRDSLAVAFDAHFRGHVLELACGPGTWTQMLAERASSVVAVDGAPEMLTLAAQATAGQDVRFVQADLFEWTPDRAYDAAFFGFWLSHVPEPRFAPFWTRLAAGLRPGGHVVFVDDAHRSPEELVFGADSSVVQRRLRDGSPHRVVKMAHTSAGLRRRLSELGWGFEMHDLPPFFWGLGTLEDRTRVD